MSQYSITALTHFAAASNVGDVTPGDLLDNPAFAIPLTLLRIVFVFIFLFMAMRSMLNVQRGGMGIMNPVNFASNSGWALTWLASLGGAYLVAFRIDIVLAVISGIGDVFSSIIDLIF